MRKFSTTSLRLAMLLPALPILSAASCAHDTTGTVRTVSDYCLIAKGISFSEPHGTDVETAANKYDTPETIKQVKEHDLSYDAVCPPSTPHP